MTPCWSDSWHFIYKKGDQRPWEGSVFTEYRAFFSHFGAMTKIPKMGLRLHCRLAPILLLVFQRVGTLKCALRSGIIFTWRMFSLFLTISGFPRRNCGIYSFPEFNDVLSLCQTQDVCRGPVRGGAWFLQGSVVRILKRELWGAGKWKTVVGRINGSELSRKLLFPCRNLLSICFCLVDSVWETSLIFFSWLHAIS